MRRGLPKKRFVHCHETILHEFAHTTHNPLSSLERTTTRLSRKTPLYPWESQIGHLFSRGYQASTGKFYSILTALRTALRYGN